MKEFTVTISDAEEKILLTDMISVQEWLDNLIHARVNRTVDKIIEELTDKQPSKITMEEKILLVSSMGLETVAERNAKIDELLGIG